MTVILDEPTIAVAVEVSGPLGRHLAAHAEARDATVAGVTSDLAVILGDLGVPGGLSVELVVLDQRPERADQWVRLRLDGRLCRYSERLLAFVAAAVDGRYPQQLHPPIDEHWTEIDGPAVLGVNRVADLICLLCAEVVKLRPSALFGLPQAVAYGRALAGSAKGLTMTPPDPRWLRVLVAAILDARLSVASVDRLREELSRSTNNDFVGTRERLIASLSRDVVELHVPEGCVDRLGIGDPANQDDLLALVASGLFAELGLLVPRLRSVPTTNTHRLTKLAVAFRLNDLLTHPYPVLNEEERLVNAPVDVLIPLDIDARPAMNPTTGLPAAIVSARDAVILESKGYTVWTAAGHVVLCLADALRRHSGCLVHEDKLQAQLDVLEDSFPEVVHAVRAQIQPAHLTGLVRTLLGDQISVRDLRLILERSVDAKYAAIGIDRYWVLDDPTTSTGKGDLAAFVRGGLRQNIAHKLSRGTGTLVVYLLDQRLEESLRGALNEKLETELLDAFRSELAFLPISAQPPVVLAWDDIRGTLKALLEPVFPDVAVVSYGDLPPDINIQPVARVNLVDPTAPSTTGDER